MVAGQFKNCAALTEKLRKNARRVIAFPIRFVLAVEGRNEGVVEGIDQVARESDDRGIEFLGDVRKLDFETKRAGGIDVRVMEIGDERLVEGRRGVIPGN